MPDMGLRLIRNSQRPQAASIIIADSPILKLKKQRLREVNSLSQILELRCESMSDSRQTASHEMGGHIGVGLWVCGSGMRVVETGRLALPGGMRHSLSPRKQGQNWYSLGPQQNLVGEGRGCMAGKVKEAGIEILNGRRLRYDKTERQQGLLQGLGLWKGGSRLLVEPEPEPALRRGLGTWYRDQA